MRANNIVFQDDATGIQQAWNKERDKRKKTARRQRERVAAAAQSAPLPSSAQRVQRRLQNRNVEEGRQLFGLFIDVPFSAWDGYAHGSGWHRGMIWDYNRDTKRFTIRINDDLYDCADIGLTWQEHNGELAGGDALGRPGGWR